MKTKIKEILVKIIATINLIVIFTTPAIPVFAAPAEAGTAENTTGRGKLTGQKGQLVGNYRVTVYCYHCNDGGEGGAESDTTATSSGRPATEHRSAAINKRGDPNGLKVGDYVVVFDEVWQIDDIGSGPGGGYDGLAFIDLYVPQSECPSCGGTYPYPQENDVPVYRAENVAEGEGGVQGEEEEGNGLPEGIDEKVIDVSQCVEIKGDAENGYYMQFAEDLDLQLEQIYDENLSTYKNVGVTDVETFKQMVKGELATEYPSLGGVVKSSDPISNGTEAEAGGNESQVNSSGGGAAGRAARQQQVEISTGRKTTHSHLT